MHRAWATIIEPVLAALEAKVVVEIGAAEGHGTEQLARWATQHAAVVHSVDPAFGFPEEEWRRRHAPVLHLHRDLSVNVVGRLNDVDAAVIDGDHNWYTVLTELRLLAGAAEQQGRPAPVCLLHDVGWPYGRRDLYYEPETIPMEHRKPYARGGLVPGVAEQVEGGFNEHLNNAQVELGEANGVLTAAEDFVGEREGWSLLELPGLHGIGILWPEAVPAAHPAFGKLVERFGSRPFLRSWLAVVEAHRLHAIAALSKHRRQGRRLSAELEQSEEEARLASEAREAAESEASRLDAVAAKRAEEARRAREVAEELRGSLERARAELKEARAKGVRLTDAVAEAESGRDELAEQVQSLEGDLAMARRSLAQHEHEIESLRSEAEHHGRERDAALTAVEVHLTGELSAQRQLESLREEQAALDAASAESERKLASAELAAVTAEAKAEARQEELERLRADLRAARDALLRASSPAPPADEAVGALEPAAPAQAAASEPLPSVARLDEPVSPPPTPPGPGSPDDAVRDWLAERYRASLGMDVRDGASEAILSRPMPVDRRGVLEPLVRSPTHPTVDVVVCVHNALDDVRLCLWSLLAKGTYPFHLIVVNDGSEAETTEALARAAQTNPAITLISNPDPPHGYTIAANLGMKASRGDYVVLLNSDTIVTYGWLERLIGSAESDRRIGVFGPLSNAASHQSVPGRREEGSWAVNPLPPWLTPDGVAGIVAGVSHQQQPSVPFVNGFCFAIRHRLLEEIGSFDEANFASGYCEENDFSFRALEAGWKLAIVDDAYVYHAKSSSYAVQGRNERAKRNYQVFLKKHGAERIDPLVAELESSTALDDIRGAVAEALSAPERGMRALHAGGLDVLQVTFVLPGLGKGGSGGSHSVYQEAQGLRALGVPARIALAADHMDRAAAAYPDADEVFVPYRSLKTLHQATRDADVVVATHYKSVALVAELRDASDDFLPAYYVQDYEPFFSQVHAADVDEAAASYTRIPDVLLFAKTHWLCNIVGQAHGVDVAKVEPSIDEQIYRPGGTLAGRPVRIAAMVRPRTPRRQAHGTLRILERLRGRLGDDVEVVTFGCEDAELRNLTDDPATIAGHRGLLRREEVAAILRESHVFLDFSVYQAFGRTALEAMACGATALVPRVGGAHEFARHDVDALMLDTFSEGPVAEALEELVRDPARLARLRAGAVETASRYSVARAALSEYVLFLHEHERRFSRMSPALAPRTNGAGVAGR